MKIIFSTDLFVRYKLDYDMLLNELYLLLLSEEYRCFFVARCEDKGVSRRPLPKISNELDFEKMIFSGSIMDNIPSHNSDDVQIFEYDYIDCYY